MTIIMIEATAEELAANRTVIDSLNNALNKFTEKVCGVSNIDWGKALAALEDNNESEVE